MVGEIDPRIAGVLVIAGVGLFLVKPVVNTVREFCETAAPPSGGHIVGYAVGALFRW